MCQAQSQHIIEAIGKVQQNKLKLSMRTTCIAFHNLNIKNVSEINNELYRK